MKKTIQKKFSGLLILLITLSTAVGIARNRWESRMEKDPIAATTTTAAPAQATAPTSTASDPMIKDETPVNCMNVRFRLNTDILAPGGTTSEFPISELKNGAPMNIPCTSFSPALKGNGQNVNGGTITVHCSSGRIVVDASSCTLEPKGCSGNFSIANLQANTFINIGSIANAATAGVACTSASPTLMINGYPTDKGQINVSCSNGTISYVSNNCGYTEPPPPPPPPPAYPAGYSVSACNAWCSDSVGTQDFTATGAECKKVTTGKGNTTTKCNTYQAQFRTCQNGQYYRTIVVVTNPVGNASAVGWGCAASPSAR